jgi:hypothetical protein
VALGGWKEISVYNLESGDLVQQLHDEGAGMIKSLAVAGECYGVKPAEVGDISLNKVGLGLVSMTGVFASGTWRRSVVSLHCIQWLAPKILNTTVFLWPQTGVVSCTL